MPELEVNERQVGAVSVLELCGEIASEEAAQTLDQRLQARILAGCVALLLDCRQVGAFDSYGIKPMVRAHISILRNEGSMKLLCAPECVRRTLESVNLIGALKTFEDEKKALGSFGS